MSTPPNPLMEQAQQSLQNPAAQAAPQANPIDALAKHPLIQAIVKAASTGAQSYGWTAMPPQERESRTGMEQQKADTLARLAQTGAYQQGELAYRGDLAKTAQQRADTQEEDVKSKTEARDTSNAIKKQALQLATEKNAWQKDLAQGRLGAVKDRISNQASQFEKTFQLRAQQVGIEQAKLELAQQGMDIKKGYLDLAGTAVQQKGTAEGLQTIQQLQSIEYEHPVLSQIFGLDDVKSRVASAQSAGVPGTAPPAGAPPAAATPTIPTNKVEAKRNQKNPPKKAGDPLGIL
jgi:hypothetical protein